METILLTGRHPDGRTLGRALAERLADTFGVPRPTGWEAAPCVQAGIVTFEEEFLAQIVLPDGSSFYDRAREAVAIAYDTGELPPLLPPPRRPG